jgi:hypothetical protein
MMPRWLPSMIWRYSSGRVVAMIQAWLNSMCPATEMIRMGNRILMPNTAMAMPTVRNMMRQNGVMTLSTVALTTALSRDTEVSRQARRLVVSRNARAMGRPPVWYPR